MISIALLAVCAHTKQAGMISFSDRRAIGARIGTYVGGAGMCIVQGLPNPRAERWAIKRIAEGATPQEAAIAAVMRDTLSVRRQILLLDNAGHGAARQGKQAPKRAHYTTGQDFVAGGTGLPSLQPVDAMASIITETRNTFVPLENRLMAALEETRCGGNWIKGEPQSSFLRVYGMENGQVLDLRIDSSPNAIHELRILLDQVHLEYPEKIVSIENESGGHREHAA